MEGRTLVALGFSTRLECHSLCRGLFAVAPVMCCHQNVYWIMREKTGDG